MRGPGPGPAEPALPKVLNQAALRPLLCCLSSALGPQQLSSLTELWALAANADHDDDDDDDDGDDDEEAHHDDGLRHILINCSSWSTQTRAARALFSLSGF